MVTATIYGVPRHATMNILVAQRQDNNTGRPSPSLHAVSAGVVFAGAEAKVHHLCQSGLLSQAASLLSRSSCSDKEDELTLGLYPGRHGTALLEVAAWLGVVVRHRWWT